MSLPAALRCFRQKTRILLSLFALLFAQPALHAAPNTPDTAGLERVSAHRAAPPSRVSAAVAGVLGEPSGELARRLPSFSRSLAFYKGRTPGEDLTAYGRKKAPNDKEGIAQVLAAAGITPERASAGQRSQAIERLGNVEYPLRDRAAVTELLDLWLVLALSEEARGRDSSAYRKAYQELREQVAKGLTAAGGGSELLMDGFDEGQLHSSHDLEPAENLVLGFRPALEKVLENLSMQPPAEAGSFEGLAQRVEEARMLRERRAELRELAFEASKAAAFSVELARRGDAAGAARQAERERTLKAELMKRMADPRFALSQRSDLNDVLGYLRRRALLDPTIAGGAGRDVATALRNRFPGIVDAGPPPPSQADQAAAAKEVDRLLKLSAAGPYMLLIDYDGLRPDTIDKMRAAREGLGQDRTPNLERFVLRRGAYLRNTVTCFPSSTYPGTVTFLTGRYSKNHLIPSNTMFFKDVKDAQDRGSLSAARKINWVDYLSTKDAHYAADTVPANVPYIFEMLQPAGLSFFPTSRGVKPRFSKEGFLFGMTGMFFEHNGSYVPFGDRGFDDLTVTAAYEMVNDGKPYRKDGSPFVPPRLMAHYFGWIDHASHAAIRGQASDEVLRFFEFQDRLLGRLMRMIERLGILDELVIAIVSDHGHLAGPAETNDPSAPAPDGNVPFAMSKRLEEEGFVLRKKKEVFQDYDAVSISDGEGTARVYLPRSGTDRWEGRHTFEELKKYRRKRDGVTVNLLESMFFVKGPSGKLNVNPAVDVGMMLGRDLPQAGLREYIVYTAKPLPGGVCEGEAGCRGSDGKPLRGAFSVLRRSTQNGQIRYRYLYRKGFDPLGYEKSVTVVRDAEGPIEGGWFQTPYFDEREWLRLTMNTDYPDGPFAIDNYFSGPDRADLIVSGRPGYCFDENAVDRSDHGYLLAPSMRSTLILAGRGIKHGIVSLEPHRSVDMIPTALAAMGATDVLKRVTLDGRVADEVLKEGFGR